LIFFTSLVFGLAGTSALAEEGVTKDRIVFGQVAALEGPAQALGQGMRQGVLAAFAEANRAGGIAGRQLELKSADDSYEPQKMIEAMKKMLGEENVFAIIGSVGTPTANAGQPIATEAKVPFIGAFTGAEFLRNPHKRYVVNVRSSYFQETEAWIEHLTKDLGSRGLRSYTRTIPSAWPGSTVSRSRWPSATCRSWPRARSGATRRR
jgi:branched-chain amino acid transport system substrate-binding protein